MVGITLSPEQIQQAPPEVRRWVQQQVALSLGLSRAAPAVEAPTRHLVGCDPGQARAILSLINGSLPVVGVFFELAREPIGVTQQGLHVLGLDEMQRHCRLQSRDQVVACLGAIDEALRRASGASDVAFSMVDGSGHCLVADETARNILALWQEIVTAHHPIRPMAPVDAVPNDGAMPTFAPPNATSMPQLSGGGPPQFAAVP